MTVGPSDYADDMPTAQAQIDSVREDIRALSDTVSVVLVRLDKMDGRFDKMDGRLDKMDGRFDKMDQRFDKMDQRFDKMDREFADLKVQFADLKGTVEKIYTLVSSKA